MLELSIPGFGELNIKHVVCDFNGTIAVDGSLIDGLEPHLKIMAKRFKLHIVTGDTHGTAKLSLEGIPCELVILAADDQGLAKQNYVLQLDSDHVVAIGNGRNDQQMLQAAKVGIAVLGEEGLAIAAVSAAQIIVPDIFSAFALLEDPERLLATLRA